MKTVVFQSYRTEGVPGWMTACMDSVRSWAGASGFDYRFFDDSFLDLAPAWYRERCAGEICPVADLARLVMARELLAGGYQRTVWVDADVLVFAPESFGVEAPDGFAFSFELWAFLDADGALQCARRVNNSVSVFTRDNRQLEFLIDASLRIAAGRSPMDKLAIGAHFVTGLARLMPIPLLAGVGIFSPLLMRDIAGEERFVASYAAQLPSPIASANLCGSLVGLSTEGAVASEADYEAVVDKCLRTRGEVVNRHVPTGSMRA